jgi:cytoskeletal protein CcmA (bactofilin family)
MLATPPTAPSSEGDIQARSPRAPRRRWLVAFLCLATLAAAIPALAQPALAMARLGAETGLWLPRLIGVARYLPFEERLVEVDGGSAAQCAHQDKVTFGESVAIDANAWICGDVTAYGGNVLVRGHIDGEVRAIDGSVTVLGDVTGGVATLGGQIALGPHAHVTGDVQVIGGALHREPGAQVGGQVRREADLAPLAGAVGRDLLEQSRFSPWMLLFWALAGALFGMVLPGRLARIRAILLTQAAPNLLAGLATLIIAIPLIVLLALTLIGIIFAAPLALALWIAWVLGTVAVGSWLGFGLSHALGRIGGSKAVAPVLATALGTALLGALEQLAWLGLPLALLAGALGLGATLRLMLFSRSSRLAEAQTKA